MEKLLMINLPCAYTGLKSYFISKPITKSYTWYGINSAMMQKIYNYRKLFLIILPPLYQK